MPAADKRRLASAARGHTAGGSLGCVRRCWRAGQPPACSAERKICGWPQSQAAARPGRAWESTRSWAPWPGRGWCRPASGLMQAFSRHEVRACSCGTVERTHRPGLPSCWQAHSPGLHAGALQPGAAQHPAQAAAQPRQAACRRPRGQAAPQAQLPAPACCGAPPSRLKVHTGTLLVPQLPVCCLTCLPGSGAG